MCVCVCVKLQIYDDISARSLGLYSQPPTSDAFALAREVLSVFLSSVWIPFRVNTHTTV